MIAVVILSPAVDIQSPESSGLAILSDVRGAGTDHAMADGRSMEHGTHTDC